MLDILPYYELQTVHFGNFCEVDEIKPHQHDFKSENVLRISMW